MYCHVCPLFLFQFLIGCWLEVCFPIPSLLKLSLLLMRFCTYHINFSCLRHNISSLTKLTNKVYRWSTIIHFIWFHYNSMLSRVSISSISFSGKDPLFFCLNFTNLFLLHTSSIYYEVVYFALDNLFLRHLVILLPYGLSLVVWTRLFRNTASGL